MAESHMTTADDYVYDRDVPDEQRRLGMLLRAFVWGQLAAAVIWAIATTAVAGGAAFRFGMVAVAAVSSAATLALERRGHVKRAATLLVTTLWLLLAGRILETGSVSHGSWFLIAVLVGEAGLFIGWRAALVTSLSSAALGSTVIVLVDRGVLASSPPPGGWPDSIAGVLVATVIGILQVAAVRLYKGGLEIARQASRRHRALFDGAPIALIELDLHEVHLDAAPSDQSLPADQLERAGARVVATDFNDTALRLLGHRRSDALRIGPPRAVLEVMVEALQSGERVIERELTLELAGEPRQVVVRAELPDDLRHVIVGLTDVTDQKRLIEQLHDARRFETVASLAGSIAHDFNNVLTISQMNADRLSRRDVALANSRELSRIRDANARAATLTHQLLVFSRRDVAHRQVFAPEGVLAKLEPLLRRTLDPRIELAVELSAQNSAVDMDPAQLDLLVTNLVHNAADAMSDAGRLRIECHRRTIANEAAEVAPGDYVSIVVTDTGHGMSAEASARAFETFFTTRPGKRAGLGLAIVRSIARNAGGTVVLDSTLAAGTRVEVLLPAAAASATQAADAAAGSERILLVEDDDGVREIARATLEDAGYRVVAVRSGDEALVTMATSTNVDLVVSDLVMPGIGGRELVTRLRSTHPTLPVLYMSGHAADGPPVLEGEMRVGFLAKPFTATQLLASVRSVLPLVGSIS